MLGDFSQNFPTLGVDLSPKERSGCLKLPFSPSNHICFGGAAKFLEHESHENTSKSRVTNTHTNQANTIQEFKSVRVFKTLVKTI